MAAFSALATSGLYVVSNVVSIRVLGVRTDALATSGSARTSVDR